MRNPCSSAVTRRRARLWCSLLFVLSGALSLVGCGDDGGPGPAGAGSFDRLAGRELVEAYRLGGPDAPEHVSFQSEPAIILDSAQNLYVLHSQQGRIAVLDAEGGFVRWIGGRGQGPGEFDMAVAMGFVGDTLWVRNSSGPRISRFLIDGTHVSTERTPFDYGYPMSWPQGVSGYLVGGRAWTDAHGLVAGQGGPVDLPVLVGDRQMASTDTLFTVSNPRGMLAGQAFAPFPEPPFVDVASDGTGILLGEWSDVSPGQLRLRFFGPDAAEIRNWSLSVPEAAVPASVRDSLISAGVAAVESMAVRLREVGIPEGSFRTTMSRSEVEDEAYLPRHYPPIRRVLVGVDGTTWIQRMDRLRPGPWLALDTNGRPLFQVSLPEGVTLRQASADAVWCTVRDELDVPYLVRWNLGGPAG
jgi:hypothetical protein